MLTPLTLAITTSLKPDADVVARAVALASELGTAFLPRPSGTVHEWCEREGIQRLLTVERDRQLLWDRATGAAYAYHPNLLPVRARLALSGGHDLFLDAMALTPGMTVLDGTLGFGTEATLAAWAVGPTGTVTGLECEPALAAVTRDGMARFPLPMREFREAMRRVTVVTADSREFLRNAPPSSVDVVYLDPFFPEHLPRSGPSVVPLAVFGCPFPIEQQTVNDACRAARVRVVVKRPADSPLPDSWGAFRTVATRKSRVVYHVWER